MRAKGWVAEAMFLAVVAGSLAAPALTSAGQHLASGSGSSSSGSSAGSSSGSSNGSSSGSSGRSSNGPGSGSGTSDGSFDVSPGLAAYQAIPATGTVLYGTLRNLPPFLLLGCVLGAIGVRVDDQPLGAQDPFGAVNKACGHIAVERLPDHSGPFSDPPRTVHASDVHLRITVDRPGHVTVVPSLPDERKNRLLPTLLAALLVVLLALAIAVTVRKNREQP